MLSPLRHLVFGDELWGCIGLPKLDAKDQEPCYNLDKATKLFRSSTFNNPIKPEVLAGSSQPGIGISAKCQTPTKPYPIYAYPCKSDETLRSCLLSSQSSDEFMIMASARCLVIFRQRSFRQFSRKSFASGPSYSQLLSGLPEASRLPRLCLVNLKA